MSNERVIYVDHSMLSTWRVCKEKARLAHTLHLSPKEESAPLSFGSAIHEAIAAYRRAPATPTVNTTTGEILPTKLEAAKLRFVSYLKSIGSALPINIEDDERRSIERGIGLLEAYHEKWKDELFEEHTRPTGEPYVEIGFSVFVTTWNSIPVMYVGRLDAIRRNRLDGRLYNWEFKTTTLGLPNFVKHVRPNHQITGYHLATRELLKVDVAGTVWDCMFVSSRKPDASKGTWMAKGIDIDKDFSRTETRRSSTDIDEFLYDLINDIRDYLTYRDSDLKRWPRSAPTACFMYGGCHFLRVCETNTNPQIIENFYEKKPWEPWKGILGEEA